MKTALAIAHVSFEDLGTFGPALTARGFEVTTVQAGIDDLAGRDADLVVVLGGPIGVYEEAKYPFLAEELKFVGDRLASGKPMLGLCLGAQLIAKAADARVYYSGQKEIGLAPITLTEAGRASPLAPFAADPLTLHWHGDTFELPQGAVLLASTPITPHQAFSLGPKVLGVQFHPEVRAASFERWLIGHAVELAQAGRDVAAMRTETARVGAALAAKGEKVLDLYLAAAGLV
jgi:GMP synthase (glutamine-hydrolysing)